FVLTFEEIMGMFEARSVEFSALTHTSKVEEGTGDGRNFAVSGGVAAAVVDVCKRLAPEREIKVMAAQGLNDCRKMLMLAKTGKLDGYLREGRACPGGCVAGAGTLTNPTTAAAALAKYKAAAPVQNAYDTKYDITLPLLHD
ncbi:MAG: [Fe-Fe] hydrogenase large subunit C-terminal domain-containing protein, partial [Ruthenibacterium sp.]